MIILKQQTKKKKNASKIQIALFTGICLVSTTRGFIFQTLRKIKNRLNTY